MTTCDYCDQAAIYHDVRIENGVHTTLNLCQHHAIEAGIELGPIDLSIVLNADATFSESKEVIVCQDCGMTIAQYKEKSLLGCPTCYETFAEQLKHIIANVQDNHTQHVGRAPSSANADVSRHLTVRRLLKQLDKAVTQEQYEEAAVLRDELRKLHEGDTFHEN
ncbi:MAG: UvrB/UvrC motif-containing protein [Planctomycetes bacterium]|nr:UvrB/UvrC motif-containing protein [Planctomycetota bacterium]